MSSGIAAFIWGGAWKTICSLFYEFFSFRASESFPVPSNIITRTKSQFMA
jgi:hypothetical protein